MVSQLLTRVVLQQVTQRVLASVLEQLPGRIAQDRANTSETAATGLDQMNALAIDEIQTKLTETQELVEHTAEQLRALEKRSRWQRVVLNIITATVVYCVGFETAVVLALLGAFN